MHEIRVRVGPGGRIVIPAACRQALDISIGDELILRLDDGGLRLLTAKQAIEQAQALVRRWVPAERSLADELIAERRAEAARE